MKIKSKLALVRREHLLSQSDVASKLMYDATTISLVENCRYRASKRLINALSEFYGKRPEELFDSSQRALKLTDKDFARLNSLRGVANGDR